MSGSQRAVGSPRPLAPRRGLSAGQALAILLVLVRAGSGVATALEADQYYAWTRCIADSTRVINAKVNLEISLALDRVNRGRSRPPSCAEVAGAVRGRLELEIFQPIELWLLQSPLVDRVPTRGEETHHYFDTGIYREHGPLDIGMWIPPSPTIEIDGVRLGSDKLAHFVSSGWKYRNAYLRRRARGLSHEEAELAAVRWGILEERTINGSLSTGIFSRADLEANYQGMRFYLELCDGSDPLLEVEDGLWRVRRPFDIAGHVTPEWDESYNTSVFGGRRWRKVRPEVERACPLLDEPMVQERLRAYRLRDHQTLTEEVLDELVETGGLSDPEPFTVEAVCGRSMVPASSAAASPRRRPSSDNDGEGLVERVLALERDRETRSFPLWGVHLSYPRGLSGTFGVLRASVPRTHDCRELCDLRGLVLQGMVGHTGGQVSVGYARMIADGSRGGLVLSNVYLAFGGRVSLLRTWGGSPLDPAQQTLAGVEGVFTITRVNFTVGAFHRVSGGGGRWVYSGSIGFGF